MSIKAMLAEDLRKIGMPVKEVDLITPRFSKKYYGFYVIRYPWSKLKKPRVYVYLCCDASGKEPYGYDFLLDTAIHEMCHHMQWRNPEYVRVKGVSHDAEFYKFYNYYIYRAKLMGVISDGYENSEAA